MASQAVTRISLDGLVKVAEGKVRDLFELDESTLLFVASDRISAFDVVMQNGVPDKGVLLTLLSAHWFRVLTSRIQGLRTHFRSLELPPRIPTSSIAMLRNRAMQVEKLKIFPLEIIVRGYLTGSAWKEYQGSQTVHGISMPVGLKESEAFPHGPLYTPSTKAPPGEHDENIHPDQAAAIVGPAYATRIQDLALKLYTTARDYAAARGIIIADTKFEFGLDTTTDEIVLCDEVLTPDSSRFWPAADYEIGREQKSYDKQGLREWLVTEGLKGKENVKMPASIVEETSQKYRDAFTMLTGTSWANAIGHA